MLISTKVDIELSRVEYNYLLLLPFFNKMCVLFNAFSWIGISSLTPIHSCYSEIARNHNRLMRDLFVVLNLYAYIFNLNTFFSFLLCALFFYFCYTFNLFFIVIILLNLIFSNGIGCHLYISFLSFNFVLLKVLAVFVIIPIPTKKKKKER